MISAALAMLILPLPSGVPWPSPHHGSAAPERAYTGKLQIHYQPILCRQAPRPRGRYRISMPGRDDVVVVAVDYDPATPRSAWVSTNGAGISPDGLAIDGRITFVAAPGLGARALIHARRAFPGLWKP